MRKASFVVAGLLCLLAVPARVRAQPQVRHVQHAQLWVFSGDPAQGLWVSAGLPLEQVRQACQDTLDWNEVAGVWDESVVVLPATNLELYAFEASAAQTYVFRSTMAWDWSAGPGAVLPLLCEDVLATEPLAWGEAPALFHDFYDPVSGGEQWGYDGGGTLASGTGRLAFVHHGQCLLRPGEVVPACQTRMVIRRVR